MRMDNYHTNTNFRLRRMHLSNIHLEMCSNSIGHAKNVRVIQFQLISKTIFKQYTTNSGYGKYSTCVLRQKFSFTSF